MNLTDSDIIKFQRGSPIFLDDICAIYPVTMGEIADFGYDKFQLCLGALTSEKPILDSKANPEFKKLVDSLTDFQYILMVATLDQETNEVLREGFRFFCHEDIFFSLEPAQIAIGPLQEKHLLTEEKFYDFQKILRRMYFIEQDDDDEIIIYEDDDPAVKTLKMQRRKRKKDLAKAKAKKAAKEGNDLKFSDLIGSITINNCGLNMENVWNITYYAFQDQLKRMGWRDQFNINNQAALAGAKLKKNQLKHWIRSITNSEKS